MTISHLKLGKKPARPEAVKFKLANYIVPKELPKPPKSFGRETLIAKNGWQMLGNDEAGDCVFAGAAHETMLWCAEAGKQTSFTTQGVFSDYSAVTGFDPSKPDTDQGTDMQKAADYRRHTGIIDANGQRHTVAAYLAIDPGNITQHFQALYLFGAVGIGIEVPSSAMDQFDRGRPWSVTRNSPIEGGHYIPLVAHRSNIICVTWGRTQPMTAGFFRKYNDESLAYVSMERLVNNKSLDGFDAQQLLDDLQALKAT